MPVDYSNYAKGWKALSNRIRFLRAMMQCECEGECGLHEGRRCCETHDQPAIYARGKIVLTVAHLCHNSRCTNESHLRAMCQRCHLRYDVPHHKANRARTRLGTDQIEIGGLAEFQTPVLPSACLFEADK